MFESDSEIISALKAKAEEVHPPFELKEKVMQSIDLTNKKGEMLAKVMVDTLDSNDPFDQIIQQLKPGTGKAIFIVANNPDKTISNQTFYETEKWSLGLKELLKKIEPYKIKLPHQSKLQEIYVIYGFDSLETWEINEMYAEAEMTGKKIIVRDLRKSNRMVGAKLLYTSDDSLFELNILTTTKNRIHVPDISKHTVERTKVGSKEAVYLSDSTNHQLLWVDDEQGINIQYEIRTSSRSKKWVFEVAKGLQ